MPNFNSVTMVGHVVRDPEVKITEKMTLAKSAIAVTDKYKDNEKTCFIDFVCFGKTGEFFGTYVKKGDPILIDGKLQQESWEKDGQKRTKHVIVVDKIQLLKGKKDQDDDVDFAQPKGSKRTKKSDVNIDDIPEDEIPF